MRPFYRDIALVAMCVFDAWLLVEVLIIVLANARMVYPATFLMHYKWMAMALLLAIIFWAVRFWRNRLK